MTTTSTANATTTTTIKPGDDLYKLYDIPVFAEIVDFEAEGGAKKK